MKLKTMPWVVAADLLLFMSTSPALAQERSVTITARANLTTSSQLFTSPDATDPIEQNKFLPLGTEIGGGLEVKYTFHDLNLAASISAEYVQAQYIGTSPSGLPLEDGYRVIPVELTAYFIVPISGPTVRVFMGGGGGAYVGRRTYRLAGVEAPSVGAKTGFGIHILGGVSYFLTPFLAVTGEMKFRDLQFDAANAFRDTYLIYNGRIIEVGTDPFSSRVHTDGAVFNLGIALTL